jgi:thioredoxin-like negative regulator of GroEL
MNTNTHCGLVKNEHDLKTTLKSQEEVFALFYASWCPFSRTFLPIFEKHAKGKQLFVLVQDDEETLSDKYSINIFPTVLFFKKGVISKRLDGLAGAGLNENKLVDFIRLCSST